MAGKLLHTACSIEARSAQLIWIVTIVFLLDAPALIWVCLIKHFSTVPVFIF